MPSADGLNPVDAYRKWCEKNDKGGIPAMQVPRMLVDPAVTSLTVEVFRLHFFLNNMVAHLKTLMSEDEVNEYLSKLDKSFSVEKVEKDAKALD
jgi:hypothetical protein